MGGRFERTEQYIVYDAELEFEYDENKSASNKEKHGIDFKEAKALWSDLNAIRSAVNYVEEPRYLLTAKCNEKLYTAVYTMRDTRIRMISVRRAHGKEVKEYEKRYQND